MLALCKQLTNSQQMLASAQNGGLCNLSELQNIRIVKRYRSSWVYVLKIYENSPPTDWAT